MLYSSRIPVLGFVWGGAYASFFIFHPESLDVTRGAPTYWILMASFLILGVLAIAWLSTLHKRLMQSTKNKIRKLTISWISVQLSFAIGFVPPIFLLIRHSMRLT